MSTVVEKYIETLKNYKKSNGTIDDAIIIAETLLLASEERQRRMDFEAGGAAGFNAALGKDVKTFEDYLNQSHEPRI
jgi:hypothetical protein